MWENPILIVVGLMVLALIIRKAYRTFSTKEGEQACGCSLCPSYSYNWKLHIGKKVDELKKN